MTKIGTGAGIMNEEEEEELDDDYDDYDYDDYEEEEVEERPREDVWVVEIKNETPEDVIPGSPFSKLITQEFRIGEKVFGLFDERLYFVKIKKLSLQDFKKIAIEYIFPKLSNGDDFRWVETNFLFRNLNEFRNKYERYYNNRSMIRNKEIEILEFIKRLKFGGHL